MVLDMGRWLRVMVAWMVLAGGSAAAQVVFPAGSALDIPAGATWNHGCSTLDVLGTVTTTGQLVGGTLSIGGTGVLHGSTGTISVGGDWNNAGTFHPGSSTVVFTDACGAPTATLGGGTVFHNLTLSSNTGRTFVVPAGTTVTGTLTLAGTALQPIQLVSASGLPVVIGLGPGAQVVRSHAMLSNVQIGAVATAAPASIPTLGEWGAALLALLLGAAALRPLRQRGARRIDSL